MIIKEYESKTGLPKDTQSLCPECCKIIDARIIERDGKVMMATGATELEVKDRVVLFARADHVREVEQMFRVSPDYF